MGFRPFPIIVGSHRSGTTLLRAMLDSHPELAVVHESRFIPELASDHARSELFQPSSFVDDLIAHPSFARLGLETEDLRAAVERARPQEFADALRATFTAYAAAAGKSRAGDKTPEYVRSMPLIGELLPESRFIHVIRDGRDVAASIVAAPLGRTDLGEAARSWVRTVSLGRRDGSRLGPARYQEVRYERLVDDPPSVLRHICEFLEIDYDDAMLHYHERADEIVRNAGIQELHEAIKKPPTPKLRDWRRELPPAELDEIEAVAGRTLSELGYELAGKSALRQRLPWMRRRRRGN
jgi:hypothetical protein